MTVWCERDPATGAIKDAWDDSPGHAPAVYIVGSLSKTRLCAECARAEPHRRQKWKTLDGQRVSKAALREERDAELMRHVTRGSGVSQKR